MTIVKTYKGHDVPEGATHCSMHEGKPSSFFKYNDLGLRMYSGCYWSNGYWSNGSTTLELIKLPQETEQWVPEVGEEFEIAESTEYLTISHEEGLIVKVYASFTDDRNIDLFAFVTADGKHAGVCTAQCFRPIKTERERFIDLALYVYNCGDQSADMAAALFDNGARFNKGEK